jgi:hypothetical protein
MSSSAQKLPLDPPRVRIANTQDSLAVQLLAKAYLPLYQPGPVGAQGCLVCQLGKPWPQELNYASPAEAGA